MLMLAFTFDDRARAMMTPSTFRLDSPSCELQPVPRVAAEAGSSIEQLARKIRDMETASRPNQASIPSGCPTMDALLPNRGYACGSMLELIRKPWGCISQNKNREPLGLGHMSIALMLAKSAIGEGKYLVLVDTQREIYPPAMKSLGIPLERVIVLQPTNHSDAVWGIDQALRCPAVGSVIADVSRLDDRIARRWQLAAEQGGGLGILLRDAHSARTQPSWADVQWQLIGFPNVPGRVDRDVRWFAMELTRCQGGRTGARIRVGINTYGQWMEPSSSIEARHEQASVMHLAAQLAKPARHRREVAG